MKAAYNYRRNHQPIKVALSIAWNDANATVAV
jgi:hypothetical protein